MSLGFRACTAPWACTPPAALHTTQCTFVIHAQPVQWNLGGREGEGGGGGVKFWDESFCCVWHVEMLGTGSSSS